MTIEQFRQNHTIDVSEPKKIDTKPVVDNMIPFVSSTKKMDEIKNATTNNSALRLKRNKPLKRDYNNLESALGLIITPKPNNLICLGVGVDGGNLSLFLL